MPQNINIFDRKVKLIHRERSHILLNENNDYLLHESAKRLGERLDEDITIPLNNICELGCKSRHLSKILSTRNDIKKYIRTDLSAISSPSIVADEEYIPFAENSFDLVISNLNLHWVNDVPGCLIQIRKTLREKGLFMASLLGGRTLFELREAAMQAEIELNKGISPRISPFMAVKDAGALLQRAGFLLPVADTETITVLYKNATTLMHDLRAMGETNAIVKRNKHFTSRTTMTAIANKYQSIFADKDGLIPATFEVITITGWRS